MTFDLAKTTQETNIVYLEGTWNGSDEFTVGAGPDLLISTSPGVNTPFADTDQVVLLLGVDPGPDISAANFI